MVFLLILGFYAGLGIEKKSVKPTVGERVWWVFGFVITSIGFLSLFAIEQSFTEAFGSDATDIDPLAMVSAAVTLLA